MNLIRLQRHFDSHFSSNFLVIFLFYYLGLILPMALKPLRSERGKGKFEFSTTSIRDLDVYIWLFISLYGCMICSTLNRFFSSHNERMQKNKTTETKYVCNVEKKSTFRDTCGHYYHHSRFDLNSSRG